MREYEKYECENTSRPRILSLTSEITSSQNVVTALWSHLGRPISEAEADQRSGDLKSPHRTWNRGKKYQSQRDAEINICTCNDYLLQLLENTMQYNAIQIICVTHTRAHTQR